ncbi:MAG: hypothetical protein WCD57_08790 [Acidobacteriaceae bacterium]
MTVPGTPVACTTTNANPWNALRPDPLVAFVTIRLAVVHAKDASNRPDM